MSYRKRTWQVEMSWTCKACSASNLGRYTKCQSCGKPKQEETYNLPSDTSFENRVQDEKRLKEAKAGSNWKCSFCGSEQRKLSGECAQCGASQQSQKIRSDINERVEKALEPKYEIVQNTNDQIGITLKKIDYSKAEQQEQYKSFDILRERINNNKKKITIGALLICGIGLIIWFLVWLFTPYHLKETVVGYKWDTVTIVNRYSVHAHESFDEGVSDDAFDKHQIDSRIHHYDHVYDHTEQEPYSESYECGEDCHTSCSDNGNGYASCSEDCEPEYCSRTAYRSVDVYRDDPVYRPWYAWKSWEWAKNREKHFYGQDHNPKWPDAEDVQLGHNLAPGEKENLEKDGEFAIVLKSPTHGHLHDFKCKDYNEFMRYQLNKNYHVTVYKYGTVVVEEP